MKSIFLKTAVMAIFLGVAVHANSASVAYSDGTQYDVDGVSAFTTTGNTMAGMNIFVTFSNGDSETAPWNNNIGAVGNGWSLGLDDYDLTTYTDVFYSPPGALWILELTDNTRSIDSIEIAAMLGEAAFDVVAGPSVVTPNSAFGLAINWEAHGLDAINTNLDFVATYSNLIGINNDPNSPYGDLYGTLTIDFDNTNPFTDRDVLSFFADTDNLIINEVPEPATVVLFGVGLLGIFGYSLRRKNS